MSIVYVESAPFNFCFRKLLLTANLRLGCKQENRKNQYVIGNKISFLMYLLNNYLVTIQIATVLGLSKYIANMVLFDK